MKKIISLFILIVILFVIITGCDDVNNSSGGKSDGLHITDNLKDYTNYIPVEISDDILQACYRYADNKGYIIKEKETYKSGLLGSNYIKYVYVGEDDTKRDLLDENDYLIVFQEMKVVIDAGTGIVLGEIPYV